MAKRKIYFLVFFHTSSKEQMEPLLPPSKKHPLGCHNPRVEVDGANRHDVKLARPTAENIQIKKPRVTKKRKQHLCL